MDHDGLVILEALGQDVQQPPKVIGFESVEVVNREEVCVNASLRESGCAPSHALALLYNSELIVGLQAKDGFDSKRGDGVEVLFDRMPSGARSARKCEAAGGTQNIGWNPGEVQENDSPNE